jgi:hypothetical protein
MKNIQSAIVLLHALIVLTACVSATAQEFDFQIPTVEHKKIEFNGNLDAKWGLLNARHGSPFYRIQFFEDDEKRDYWSQYRLDYYFNGDYRQDKTQFVAKTFTQYSKEEPLTFSFYELYGSLNLSPKLSFGIGKKRFTWGKGYAFNPVGYINAEKDPENPDLALAGKSAAFFSYNKSFGQNTLQNIAFTGVILPPDAEINDKFAPAADTKIAANLYLLINDIDIDVMMYLGRDNEKRFGFDFSTNLRENLEIHSEFSYNRNDTKYVMRGSGVLPVSTNGSSYLTGIRYLNRFNTTIFVEYYHSHTGLTSHEYDDYFTFIEIATDAGALEAVNAARAVQSGGFKQKTLMRDYLYINAKQPEPFSLLYSSFSIFTLYNLADHSFILSPRFTYTPVTDFELWLWPFFFLGNDESEYGSKQFSHKVEVWARFYF